MELSKRIFISFFFMVFFLLFRKPFEVIIFVYENVRINHSNNIYFVKSDVESYWYINHHQVLKVQQSCYFIGVKNSF